MRVLERWNFKPFHPSKPTTTEMERRRSWRESNSGDYSIEKCSSAANHQTRYLDDRNIWIWYRPVTITRFSATLRARIDIGNMPACQRLRSPYHLLSTSKSSCEFRRKFLSTSPWAAFSRFDFRRRKRRPRGSWCFDWSRLLLAFSDRRFKTGVRADQQRYKPRLADSSSTQVNFTNTYALRVEIQTMDENVSENMALERKLSEFWDLGSIGISLEEKSVYDRFNEDIKFKDGRYEVKLPWRECHETLPDNCTLC